MECSDDCVLSPCPQHLHVLVEVGGDFACLPDGLAGEGEGEEVFEGSARMMIIIMTDPSEDACPVVNVVEMMERNVW